ncbi:MAG: nitrophenyl compound nitroreductase subunit ArsF family protein [Acidobacteriales bacterium]|nr:nitrophenyl compound nitroreductase subunit ArsF family protein [Terriglobales bacterium]
MLLLFVAASLAFLLFKPGRRAETPVQAAEPGTSRPGGRRVVAYYFHATQRCATCRSIESQSGEAITTTFASELARGTLEWRPVNVQLPQNRHFVQDYQLFTRSLVLVEFKAGRQVRYKVLEKTWELVGNKTALQEYVVREVRAMLGGS